MAKTEAGATPIGRRFRQERGAALVEFAICATLFLGLLYGSISYGMVFWVKHGLTSAAAEGARYAIRVPDQVQVANRAKERADANLPTNFALATATPPAGCPNDPGAQCMTVTVTYAYKDHAVLPALPPFFMFLPDELKSVSTIQVS